MGFYTPLLLILLLTAATTTVNGNIEGDVLFGWKKTLHDPFNVLQSWDPTLANPCTWFHVTCNSRNSIVRVDLGNALLTGPLSPDLAKLTQLQYLELYSNNLTGVIPPEFGKLKHLRSLDLYKNRLSGSIPASLGNLKSLMFLRVNNNALTGRIPTEIFALFQFRNLKIIDVSSNFLAGSVRPTKVKGIVKTIIWQDPRA